MLLIKQNQCNIDYKLEVNVGYFVEICRNMRKVMNDFQESLQELMVENNLNRLQLSKRLGISSTAVNGYFNYNYYPNIDTAIKMCEIFSCSLDYLFGLTDNSKMEYTFDTEKISENFNFNLKNLLTKNKITNAKFMKSLQLDEYTFYHWRQGKLPKVSNLIAISKYFGVSLDFLVGHNDE